jgi:UrcA family protein
MNTSTASTGLGGVIATAIFGALALSFTAVSAADPSSASVNVNYNEKLPAPETRAVRVPLADLDLSTLEGRRAARERLHETARRLCSQLVDIQDLSHQPNFVACVDDALNDALRQVAALRQATGATLASAPGSHDVSR